MQIWNGSDEYCWRYRADTILSTDGQTDKVIPVYPLFNFVEAGGIMKLKCTLVKLFSHVSGTYELNGINETIVFASDCSQNNNISCSIIFQLFQKKTSSYVARDADGLGCQATSNHWPHIHQDASNEQVSPKQNHPSWHNMTTIYERSIQSTSQHHFEMHQLECLFIRTEYEVCDS